MTDAPVQTWWSAAEIAAANLPDMPATARGVNDMIKRNGWVNHADKIRRRAGRGGGLEYHFSLFPTRAKVALQRATQAQPVPVRKSREDAWAAFEKKTPAARAKAELRLKALQEVHGLETAGLTRTEAVRAVGAQYQTAEKTVWNWLSMIDGIDPADWLPHLAPGAGGQNGSTVEVDQAFLDVVKGYYLTQSGPDLTAAYDWALDVAKAEKLPVAPLWKIRRIIKATVPEQVIAYHREGPYALARYYPHQTRDRSYMHALEAVQTDYHKFDVLVMLPGRDKACRIQMIAISDIYSGKFLAWRLSETANGHTVQLAFGDLVRRYGIPRHCLMDNGHEFVNKIMSGQVQYRNRYKLVEGEVLGLFPLLGIELHFATPGWGQAKPIERAFRDFCARVAKHPALVGAYTGRNTVEKPENYGSRAVTLEEFSAVLEREIAAHNARRGRRSEVANKRSFDEVFNASYSNAPITKATEEQQRLWLMRAEGVRANATNGELALHGSRYWAEWMWQIKGRDVTVRFDPDDLQGGLLVYEMDGTFLGEAPVKKAGQFFSVADAKEHARDKKAFQRATREQARIHKKWSDRQLAARLEKAQENQTGDGLPDAGVIRLPKIHPNAPKGGRRKAVAPEVEERLAASVTRLEQRMKAPVPDERDPEADFARALELQQMAEDGHPLNQEQSEWLQDYTGTSEYRARAMMYAALGKKKD